MDVNISDKGLALTISAVGDSPVQSCGVTRNVREKLQIRYAGKTLLDELGVLNSLLNLKGSKRTDRRRYRQVRNKLCTACRNG